MVYKYREIYKAISLIRLLRVVLAGISLASILAVLGLGLRRITVLVRQLVPDGFEESFVLLPVASGLGR